MVTDLALGHGDDALGNAQAGEGGRAGQLVGVAVGKRTRQGGDKNDHEQSGSCDDSDTTTGTSGRH